MASVTTPSTAGDIVFIRSNGKILNNICHACRLPGTIKDTDDGLILDMGLLSLTLCNFHEGMLLEKLLTNYLKRRLRRRTIGFMGPIAKPKPEEILIA